MIIGGSVLGVLLVAYIIARSFNGPATPEELQQKFSDALKAHDTATLSTLLDADSKALKEANSLATFKASLSNDEVIAAYLQQLQQVVDKAIAEQATKLTNASSDHSWLTVKHTTSWLGDNWKVHVAAVGVKVPAIPLNTVEFSISEVKSTDAVISNLWPSTYPFKATVSNTFAKEEHLLNRVWPNTLWKSSIMLLCGGQKPITMGSCPKWQALTLMVNIINRLVNK